MFKILLIVLIASTAHAGVSRVGNGGIGVTCKSAPQIRLLDLFNACTTEEALSCYIEETDPTVRSYRDWIREYKSRLSVVVPADHPILKVFDLAQTLGANPTLASVVAPTVDVGTMEIPEGCEPVQIGNSLLQSSILKVTALDTYWMHASAKEQALFLIHEAAHTYFTDDEDFGGSARLRRFVFGRRKFVPSRRRPPQNSLRQETSRVQI